VRIQPETDPDPAEVGILERGVTELMQRTRPGDLPIELAAFLRDDASRVCGGVYGWTWGGCCELDLLWVHPRWRRRGYASALLGWAETEARIRGCTQVVLFTHASQQPGIYLGRGYALVGRVEDYPTGDAALWFRKALSPSSAGSRG
jgi:GNAT superfamily N-acetyltransferase